MVFFKKAKRRSKEKAARLESVRLRTAMLTCMYQDFALNRTEPGVARDEVPPIIVSLTTYSKRINQVHLAIESLFQQSCRAEKIVLWISGKDFSPDDIPYALRNQCKRGLEIEFCDEDLGPYTKFYYALKKYPDRLILTVDDDLLYPADMIDQLYRSYLRQPDTIFCHRAHLMKLGEAGAVLPYMQWDLCTSQGSASGLIFPTGVGGVLYFPGCFDAEILNREAFMRLAPKADDIWLKAMSLKRGTPCRVVEDPREWTQRFLFIEGSQKYALKHENMHGEDGNDVKMRAVFDEYGLWPLLR